MLGRTSWRRRSLSAVSDLFALDEAEEGQSPAAVSSVQKLKKIMAPPSDAAAQLTLDAADALAAADATDAGPTHGLPPSHVVGAGLGLGARGARRRMWLRTSVVEDAHVLSHTFLVVQEEGELYIVDPTFRQQFELAAPTARYEAVLNALPGVVVATAEQIHALISFMCDEIKATFERSEVYSLPPWRQTHAMLARWLPAKARDEQLPDPASDTYGGRRPNNLLQHQLSVEDDVVGMPGLGLAASADGVAVIHSQPAGKQLRA